MITFVNRLCALLAGKLHSTSFVRSVAVLTGGTALAQGLVVLVSPLLTRLYTPADFGVLTVYASIFSILLMVVSLRYETAIPLPEDDESAANLLALSLALVATMSVLVEAGVWLFGNPVARWTSTPVLKAYFWFLPVSLIGAGSYQVFSYWAIRKRTFAAIAQAKMSQGLGMALTQVGLGLLRLGPVGLLLGDVVGRVSGSGILMAMVWRQGKEAFKQVSIPGMRWVAHRYLRFPLFSSWSSLLNGVSLQLPVLLLASLFGSTVAGWFALSLRTLQTPMMFLGQAIAQVFLSHASVANQRGSVSELTWEVYKRLVVLGIAPIFLIATIAPELFTLVFGKNWRTAGLYAQWLSPWLFFVFVTSPLSSLIFVLEQQRADLFFQASLLGGRVFAIVLGAHFGSAALAVAAYGVVGALLWFGYMLWIVRISGNRPTDALALVLKEIAVHLLLIAPIVLVKVMSEDPVYILCSALIVAMSIGYRAFVKIRG